MSPITQKRNAQFQLRPPFSEEMVDFMVDKIREFVEDKGKKEG